MTPVAGGTAVDADDEVVAGGPADPGGSCDDECDPDCESCDP